MVNPSKRSSNLQETSQTGPSGVTFRAILLGIILIPPNTYFIMANHLRYRSTLPTTMSLIYNVVVTLVVLTYLNFLVKRLLPRFALRQGELLTIYVILSISSAIAGHDMMQTLVPVIPNGFWFATPENEWQQLFWRYLPSWLTLKQLVRLTRFLRWRSLCLLDAVSGGLVGTGFMVDDLSIRADMGDDMHRSIASEAVDRNGNGLTYPIVRLPIEMTHSDGRLFKNKMLWAGFAIAASIELINGIHAFFPTFPEIPVRKVDLGIYFTEKPWSAIGWTPLYILSFGVGLAFLMPLEMSFSLWFFYFFWKGERILGSAMGLQALPGFPYDGPTRGRARISGSPVLGSTADVSISMRYLEI